MKTGLPLLAAMWRTRTLLAAACLCVPIFAAAAAAPPARGSQVIPEAIDGRVIDAEGNPKAGATVVIVDKLALKRIECADNNSSVDCLDRLLADGVARAHGVSGNDGRFSLQVPGGLKYIDTVWAEGKDAEGGIIRTYWQLGGIRALPNSTLGDIRLSQRVDFIIAVQGDGKPLADAQVNFVSANPQRTDATGSTTRHLDVTLGPRQLKPMYIMVHADGFATAAWRGLLAAGTTTQVIDLEREAPLTGRIRDAGGRSLAQANLKAIFFPDPPDFVSGLDPVVGTARTDATGAFTLHGLRAGQQYRIIIETDNLALASGERTITGGSGPLDIVMSAAVPVKLAISGLCGPWPAKAQRVVMPKAPVVINRNASCTSRTNMGFIEMGLVKEPDLVSGTDANWGWRGVPVVILMEWLDPETGAWVPVFSPRRAKAKDATRAELQFDRVPVGTIRIRTTGAYVAAGETFGPFTVKAGVPDVIPIQATTRK